MTKLRAFRGQLAHLKRKGLLQGIDARKAYPTDKHKGKYLATLIDRFDDVLSGKVTPIKLNPSQLRAYRKTGYSTVNDRVLVPHSLAETVTRSKGRIKITHKAGVERVQVPVEFHSLEQYLTDLKRKKKAIRGLRGDKEYFGFRFYGNNSSDVYSDIDQAVRRLRSYKAVKNAASNDDQMEVYRNIEIITIKSPSLWFKETRETKVIRKKAKAKKRRTYFANLKLAKNSERYENHKAKERERVKIWRSKKKKK